MKIGDTVKIIRYGHAPRHTLRKNGSITDLHKEGEENFATVSIHETGEEHTYNIQKLKLVGISNNKKIDTEVNGFVTPEAMSKLGLKRETKIRFML